MVEHVQSIGIIRAFCLPGRRFKILSAWGERRNCWVVAYLEGISNQVDTMTYRQVYPIGFQHYQYMILISSYRSNIFGMQFDYVMDGALQIYHRHPHVVVDLLYNIVWVVRKVSYL